MQSSLLGYTIGEATPYRASFIALKQPRMGEYVILEFDGRRFLGLVELVVSGSVTLPEDVHDARIVEKIRRLGDSRDVYVKGRIQILGEIETLEIPRTPPPPGTEVLEAGVDDLKNVFGPCGKQWIPVGTLIAHPEVEVYVNLNKIVSRHLAILAITGAGKSNTVAVLTEGILARKGAVVIFDMHGEYTSLNFKNGRVNRIEPKINPSYMYVAELLTLMNINPAMAFKQAAYFRRVYNRARSLVKHYFNVERTVKGLVECLFEAIREYEEAARPYLEKKGRNSSKLKPPSDKGEISVGSSIEAREIIGKMFEIRSKLENMLEEYRDVISDTAPDVVDSIRKGYANVVDLGSVDERAADVIVSHYLRRILYERKRARLGAESRLNYPILLVLEEAHILAPYDRETLSKKWIARIAREGRKFGVGLCLVSQRPKALDVNALSQANNMIVLKLVEPSDQRHVQRASESLSDELLEHLPGLNVGEAILLGPMVRVPALVKIRRFEGKIVGGDIDVVGEWLEEEETISPDELLGEW